VKAITLKELLAEKNGWRFNPSSIELEYWRDGRRFYAVDLERCNTSAQILDWIFQLKGKTWFSPEGLWELLEAFDLLANTIQSKVCSFGRDKPFNFAERLREQGLIK